VNGVFVVEPVRAYRDALVSALSARGLEVVGSGARISDVDVVTSSPRVVVIGAAALGSSDELDAIHDVDGSTKVVALGIEEQDEDVVACAEAGVAGFVSSENSIDELIEGLACVDLGEAALSPHVGTILLRRVASVSKANQHDAHVIRLTLRERQVAELIDAGMSNKEIATQLCISMATVKNHVHNIFEKLEIRRRSEVPEAIRSKGRI
jgi:two-component system nitrate/nitrite response regulator NarL